MSRNLTAEQEMNLAALRSVHQPILDQLAVLRASRGTRNVGSVEVPRHLQHPEVIKLHTNTGDPRACSVCGSGLQQGEGPGVCNRCASDPTSDIGVEPRADVRPGFSVGGR